MFRVERAAGFKKYFRRTLNVTTLVFCLLFIRAFFVVNNAPYEVTVNGVPEIVQPK